MSSFTKKLTVTKIGPQRWRIETPFKYYLNDKNGEYIQIPAGYETDFATVPRIFWGVFPPATGNYVQAAVIHDFLCEGGYVFLNQFNRYRPDPDEINKIFLQAMKVLKTPKIKRTIIYWFVQIYFTIFRPIKR